jgi:uncharacterized membrane protein YedE/YeeE
MYTTTFSFFVAALVFYIIGYVWKAIFLRRCKKYDKPSLDLTFSSLKEFGLITLMYLYSVICLAVGIILAIVCVCVR